MTNLDTLTRETRSTIIDHDLEVEVFATEHEAASAWNTVLSYVERQAATNAAATEPLASNGE